MEAALRVALDRHGMSVEVTPSMQAVEAVMVRAPDLVLLIGDAATEGSVGLLRHLAENPVTSVVPVALLSNDNALDERMRAFRSGAVAVVPKSASADAVARKIVQLARELPERAGEAAGELGDTTLEDLMNWVTSELRSGILSVETKDASGKPMPMRLVLGSGGQVSDALTDFVARLRPLVSKAEPVRYELLESTGGRLGLLEDDQAEPGDLTIFQGIRILLMDNDPGRADVLAQALREHGATVALTDPSVPGLERARSLDPDVVLFDAAAIDGPGFEAVRELRRDTRLRWAGLLVVRWEELWPKTAASPDLPQLASRVTPLIQHERSLTERANSVEAFDTRLELTGPARLIRTLARIPGTRHVIVRNPKATVELDLADGLIVGAQGTRHGDSPLPLNGTVAIAALLALSAGRVRVERRGHPSVANVMTPVDEALHNAQAERSLVAPTMPPPEGMTIPSDELDDEEELSSPSMKPVKAEPMPSASALKKATLPKPAAATLAGVGTRATPSPAENSWSTPPAPPAPAPQTTAAPAPAQQKARTAFGMGAPMPKPPQKPPSEPAPASSSAFGSSAFGSPSPAPAPKKPVARTMMGMGAAGAFSSGPGGIRQPSQGATDETRPKTAPPEGIPIGRVAPQPPKPTKKATMAGLGSFDDAFTPAVTGPRGPKSGLLPPAAPGRAETRGVFDMRDADDEEDISEQTVIGDSLAHVRDALAEQEFGRTTPVTGAIRDDVATADTLRPATSALLGIMNTTVRTTAADIPVGVPVPEDVARSNRASVPAPGGTWSDRPHAARQSQPPSAAAGAFGGAKTPTPPVAIPGPAPVPTVGRGPVPVSDPVVAQKHGAITVPFKIESPETDLATTVRPATPAPAPVAAPPSVTASDESNTVATGEHTLIIPRDRALMADQPRSKKALVIVGIGTLVIVCAAVLGVVASRTMIARNAERAENAAGTAPTQTPGAAPVAAVDAGAPRVAPAPAPAPTPVVAAATPDAAAAAAPSVPDAAIAAVVAPPVPTPPQAPTGAVDLSGITPDARLPRDDADASDVLVEDALRMIAAGNLAAARVALDRAVERDRINPQAYEAYARYDIAARSFPHAIEMAQRAVTLRRNKSEYLLVLGDAYAAASDTTNARDAWQRCVAMDRNRQCRARLEAP